MINIYDLGDQPRLTATFSVNDVNTTPTAAVLIVKHPDGTYKSFLSSGFASQGSWNASENTPTLENETGTAGHYYTVSVAGSVDFGDGSQAFAAGDYVAYDGESWLKIPTPQSGNLSLEDVGILYYDLPLHQHGRYVYRFEGFGNVHAAGEMALRVLHSSIR
ncbi:MAG: hypothetical protein DWQ04_07025 [Chloroflexi bacterium]|nr:MAG: hypothetical protein DWQ04_07025 [Chloroflexota bacterium]